MSAELLAAEAARADGCGIVGGLDRIGDLLAFPADDGNEAAGEVTQPATEDGYALDRGDGRPAPPDGSGRRS